MRRWVLNGMLSAVLLVCSESKAEVRLPALISDGMVLQRGEKVRIWGWADPGERVEVTIVGQREVVQAGGEGRWLAILKPIKSQGPFELIVTGENVLRVRDVLVGEVWLASGQSNMAFRLQGAQDAYAWANNPEGCNLYNRAGVPASPFTTAKYPSKIKKEN